MAGAGSWNNFAMQKSAFRPERGNFASAVDGLADETGLDRTHFAGVQHIQRKDAGVGRSEHFSYRLAGGGQPVTLTIPEGAGGAVEERRSGVIFAHVQNMQTWDRWRPVGFLESGRRPLTL